MAEQIVVQAEFREQVGKGASRRLRRLDEKVPGILYGGGRDPVALSIAARDLAKAMQEEAFSSRILNIAVGDVTQACVLREVQRHPATERVQHVDFLRIREDLPVHMNVPLRFINEEQCAGVKLDGGRLAHNLIEIEVSCLPRHLPESIEVDVADMHVGQSLALVRSRVAGRRQHRRLGPRRRPRHAGHQRDGAARRPERGRCTKTSKSKSPKRKSSRTASSRPASVRPLWPFA